MAVTVSVAKRKVDSRLLVALGVVAVAAFALWFFTIRTSYVQPVPETTPVERLDIAILRDQRFADLVMPRGAKVETAGERFGRPNPFEELNPKAVQTPAGVVPNSNAPAETEGGATPEYATSTPI